MADQCVARLVKRLEPEYQKAFPYNPAVEFFARLDAVGEKLQARLAQRPITKAEINAAGEKAFKHLRAAIREEAKKIKQPRYRECTNIETGEVRLIPDYD